MLQRLGDHIRNCRARAAEAEARAAATSEPDLRGEYLALSKQWLHLAQSYEFAESLERFLLDAQKAKNEQSIEPPRST